MIWYYLATSLFSIILGTIFGIIYSRILQAKSYKNIGFSNYIISNEENIRLLKRNINALKIYDIQVLEKRFKELEKATSQINKDLDEHLDEHELKAMGLYGDIDLSDLNLE